MVLLLGSPLMIQPLVRSPTVRHTLVVLLLGSPLMIHPLVRSPTVRDTHIDGITAGIPSHDPALGEVTHC